MRQRKRTQSSSQTLIMVMIVVVGLALLTVLVSSQVFSVRKILVVGNRNLLKEEIITKSGVMIGDNLLSLSDDVIRRRLEENRYIKYLGHEFDYNGTLTLKIAESRGKAEINVFGLYYVLDERGMVLECAGSTFPDNVEGPKINGFAIDSNNRIQVGQILPAGNKLQIYAAEKILASMDKAMMLEEISILDISNLNNIYAMNRDGAKIVLGDAENLDAKMFIAREVIGIRAPLGSLKGARIDVSSGRDAHYIPQVLPSPTPVATPTPIP